MLLAAETRAHVAWGIVRDQQGQVYFADVLHGGTVWNGDQSGDGLGKDFAVVYHGNR